MSDFIELKAPKLFSHVQPPPVYYYNKRKNEEYVIFAPSLWSYNICYKYNITKNEYYNFAPYPKKFSTYSHGHAVEPKDGKYYIFAGGKRILGEFDLNSEDNDAKWKVHHHDVTSDEDKLEARKLVHSLGVCIPHWNKLLLIAPTHTCLVDLAQQNKTFMNIKEYGIELPHHMNYGEFQILYSKPLERLYIIIARHSNMLCLHCKKPYDKDTNGFKEIPVSSTIINSLFSDIYCLLSSNGYIITVVNVETKEAESLDIGHANGEWVKGNYIFDQLQKNVGGLDIVVGKKNDAYIFNTYPQHNLFCFKMSLNDIIPKEILNRYSEPLVYGFVRESAVGLSIPDELVQMIVTFYM